MWIPTWTRCNSMQYLRFSTYYHTLFCNKMAPPPQLGFTSTGIPGREISENWIGRQDPLPWSPRSPDITPLVFYMWGYVKSTVYPSPVTRIDNLKKGITDEIMIIHAHMPLRIWQGLGIDWTLTVLPRVPTFRRTNVSYKLWEFRQ